MCDIPHDTVKINPIVCSVISLFPTIAQRFIESVTNIMFGKRGVGIEEIIAIGDICLYNTEVITCRA
jgi:hypothetical protein